ncbi:FxsA family protein [Marinospirillum sp.]|uniref:FxsA family protein n=1 Tax=Marinospirillum sp. TaxID=2183934 RepID=UPI003A8623D6
MPLLFFLLVWPLAEIWLMIEIGQQAGGFNTLLLIIGTALIGLLLVQMEWRKISLQLREKLMRRETPLPLLLESMALGLAGVLFLIPGFISDFIALLLLIPISRKFLLLPLKNSAVGTTYDGQARRADAPDFEQVDRTGSSSARPQHKAHRPQVLEGEYEKKED